MAGEIFISYRRADAAWARLLHDQLRALGVEPWYDAHVGAGQDWRVATAKALEASRIFVLLFSSNAAQSSDIAKELAAATLEKKLIIPVRLENIAPKGAFLYELASRNWINAYEKPRRNWPNWPRVLPVWSRRSAGQKPAAVRAPRAGAQAAKQAPSDLPRRSPSGPVSPSPHGCCGRRRTGRWKAAVPSSRPRRWRASPSFRQTGKCSPTPPDPQETNARSMCAISRVATGSRSPATPMMMSRQPGRPTVRALPMSRKGRASPAASWWPAFRPERQGKSHVARAAQPFLVSWKPGTSFLYYFDRVGAVEVLIRLDLDSGALLQLPKSSPTLILSMEYLQCSPDGKFLVYVKNRSASTYSMVIRDLASGDEKNIGHAGRWMAGHLVRRIPGPCWLARPKASAANSPPIR